MDFLSALILSVLRVDLSGSEHLNLAFLWQPMTDFNFCQRRPLQGTKEQSAVSVFPFWASSEDDPA